MPRAEIFVRYATNNNHIVTTQVIVDILTPHSRLTANQSVVVIMYCHYDDDNMVYRKYFR